MMISLAVKCAFVILKKNAYDQYTRASFVGYLINIFIDDTFDLLNLKNSKKI